VDRGGSCPYDTKALNAQAQGAVGVIIVNNVPGVFDMSATSGVPIPFVLVSPEDGAAIRAAFATSPVSVTISRQRAVTRDGGIDNQVVAHEWGHYLSYRLVGNSAGLTNNQGLSMSEGWGDFSALLMTVKPEDALVPSNAGFSGVYGTFSFAIDNSTGPTNAYYFGFRRYPYSTDLTKNPLTFKHIQDGVALPV